MRGFIAGQAALFTPTAIVMTALRKSIFENFFKFLVQFLLHNFAVSSPMIQANKFVVVTPPLLGMILMNTTAETLRFPRTPHRIFRLN